MSDIVERLRGLHVTRHPSRSIVECDETTILETANEIERLRAALREIADTAHEGGLQNMDESMAMIRIRKSTLPYWKNRAALGEKP